MIKQLDQSISGSPIPLKRQPRQSRSSLKAKSKLKWIARSGNYENPLATVRVTRRGQMTIPVEFRKKYHIQEGTTMEMQDIGEGLLLKKMFSTIDLIGHNARYSPSWIE